MTGPSGKRRRTEAKQRWTTDDALCDGEKRPSKLKFDGVASGIDQPELPGAVDFKLPCEDGPSRFFVGKTVLRLKLWMIFQRAAWQARLTRRQERTERFFFLRSDGRFHGLIAPKIAPNYIIDYIENYIRN
jgi:hypothetical protein